MRKLTLLFMLFFVASFFSANAQAVKENDTIEVATIEDLRSAEQGKIYRITGEVILTYQQDWRGQRYIQDETAGILIDDNDGIIETEYDVYDGITDMTGTLGEFGNMLQFAPVEDPGDTTSTDNVVEPLVITLQDFNENFMDYQARLVTIDSVSFVSPGETFTGGQEYEITDGVDTAIFRATFYDVDYIGDQTPSGPWNITGLPNSRDEGDFITARNWGDFETLLVVDVTFDIIDEENNEILDAVVTLGEETNDPGDYFFEDVPVGTHSYSVTREGYHDRVGSLSVPDEDITYTIVLVEESDHMIVDFPWTEDFEVAPEDWSVYHYGEFGWDLTDQSHTGDSAAFHDRTTGYADSWAVTPQMKLPDEKEMLLKFFENNAFMPDYGYSGVKISTGSGNPEHEEFVEVFEGDQAVDDYTERIIDLSDYVGQVIYIAFVYQGDEAHRWFVDDISVEEVEIIEVDNIAELRTYEDAIGTNLIFEITGEVIITHQQLPYRNQRYIQDDTGALLIDDNPGTIETDYNVYDGIVGLRGNLSTFNAVLQIVPTEDPGAPSSTGNEVDPIELTIADLADEHESMLGIIRNVSFEDPEGVVFERNTGYPFSDNTGSTQAYMPNAANALDYYGEPLPTEPKDLIGIVTRFFDSMQFLPRSSEDFLEADDPNIVSSTETLEINIYPNPANNYFHVTGKDVIDNVRVFNVNGQMVMDKAVNDNDIRIDVSALNTGIYIIQVISGQEMVNYKLQVQR